MDNSEYVYINYGEIRVKIMFVKRDIKIINRFILVSLLIVSVLWSNLFVSTSRAETMKDGNYKVPISLIHKYEDRKSMGNPAMTQYGILSVKNGKATMKLRFVALDFMGYRGFLGEFYVKGQKVKELSHYDDIDVYNNPSTGKDKRMKGKKYPKDLEFEVNVGEQDIPVAVYVPVMEEVSGGNGGGQQEAKLRVAWDKSAKVASDSFDGLDSSAPSPPVNNGPSEQDDTDSIYSPKDKRNLPQLEKGEDLKLEDGLYSLVVNLHHEREDKPSMGNGAMVHTANIVAKNGKYTMLIGSDKMEVQGIIASLVSLQIRDDNAYYRFAEPHAFDLVIPNEQDKRPRVFSFDISRKDPMIYVKVDPKVKPMGEIPVGARFKFDWSSLKKIDQKDALLYNLMKTGTPRKKFNPNETIIKKTDIFELVAKPGCFKDNIKFKVDTVTGGNDYTKVMKTFGRSSSFVIYNFKVENDYGVPQKPSKPIEIKLKLPSNIKNPKAVYVSDMSDVSIKTSNGYSNLNLNKLGQVAIVSSDGGPNRASTRDKFPGLNKKSSASTGARSSNNRSGSSDRKNSNKSHSSGNKAKSKKNNSETSSGSKSSNSESTSTSDPSKGLINESTNFDQSTSEDEPKEENSTDIKKQKFEAKENPKVIFYSLLIIISILAGSAYSYIKVAKKLIYEIKLSKKLDSELSKNIFKKDTVIGSWLDSLQGGRDENK